MQRIVEIEKLILQRTENKSDICEALKKENKQLADGIAACKQIHLKYVTLIKDQHNIEEEKQSVSPFVNSYSKFSSAIQVLI